jgi:hypothetical protein
MVMNYPEAIKTPEGIFLYDLQEQFGFTPVVARAVLQRAEEMMGRGSPDSLRPGQIVFVAVSTDEPSGKPLSICKKKEIVLTIDGGIEDRKTLSESGLIGLRRKILLRIASEAAEQGAWLTQADVARLLLTSERTVRRDVHYFSKQGIYLPLRGQMINTGRGQTHKVKIVEFIIKGFTYSEVRRKTYHSIEAIERYVAMFGRIAILAEKGLFPEQIAQVVNISTSLAKEYLELYHRVNSPEYRDEIQRITRRFVVDDNIKKTVRRGVMF